MSSEPIASAGKAPILEVKGIGKRFGGLTALSDVSFSIAAGEIYGLIGPNGAGKTTLFNVLTGIYRQDEGRVRFRGEALEDPTPDRIATLGIAQRGNELARHLSYGDQRRLEIARALATEPRLLALDEPAAGMNATEKVELRKLLESIRADGVTILLIEHDVRLVMGLCDRVLVLDYGRKIAEGVPKEIQKDPRVIAAYLGKPREEGEP
jgi:branched-chain amino acid transport system ATP-binding protein